MRSEPDTSRSADARRLLLRLQALGTPDRTAPDGQRLLSDPDPMAAIGREIDETVLPRTLMFENDRGQRLGLEVASRRILSLAALDAALALPLPPDLPGHAFFDADDPLCDDLFRALAAFCAGTRQVRVRSYLSTESGSFSNIGVPLGALVEAARPVAPKPRADPDPQVLKAFLSVCRGAAAALIRADRSGLLESQGDPALAARLARMAVRELSQQDDAGPQRAQAVLLGGSYPDGAFLLCLACLGQMVFAVLAPGRVESVLDAWARHFPQDKAD